MSILHNPRLSPLAFSPALWLDFSDASTLFTEVGGTVNVAAGGTIGQVNDKSGNGRHATQGSVGNRPTRQVGVIGGRDVGNFTGTSCGFTFSRLSTIRTVFVVAKWTAASGDYRVAFVGDTVNQPAFHGGVGSALFDSFNTGAAVYNGTRHINSVSTSGALSKYTTTKLHAFTTTANVTANTIGLERSAFPTRAFLGDLAEVIIYPTALTTDQRQRVEIYLNSKYLIY